MNIYRDPETPKEAAICLIRWSFERGIAPHEIGTTGRYSSNWQAQIGGYHWIDWGKPTAKSIKLKYGQIVGVITLYPDTEVWAIFKIADLYKELGRESSSLPKQLLLF